MAIDIESMFDNFNDDYGKFEKVENKRASRPDLHAFLLLNELLPGTSDIVVAAEHDQIWLGIDIDELAEVITTEQVQELSRCGIMYADDSLSMFV